MRARILKVAIASLAVALLMGGGCTEPPLGYQGAGRIQSLPGLAGDASALVDGEGGLATLPGLCISDGVICHKSGNCCSGVCDPGSSACNGLSGGSKQPACAADGVVCDTSTDCCDGYCGAMGICGATPSPVCVPEGIICHSTQDCCNPGSDGGGPGAFCTPAFGPGKPMVCGTPQAFPECVPFGVRCLVPADCCVGTCTLNENLELVCDIPPIAPDGSF